jgi:hypothetical protein
VDGRDEPGHDEVLERSSTATKASSCPAEVPGIHEFHCIEVGEDVDGRDKPGHDEVMG